MIHAHGHMPINEELLARIFEKLKVHSALQEDVRRYLKGDRSVLDMPVQYDEITGLQIPSDMSRAAKISRIARNYIELLFPVPE
jgi:hypothetical protein